MPVLDGFGLAAAIRSDEAVHGMPRTGLIAVTADALKGEDARCYAAGMDAFLPKPVSVDALARALARWIPDLAAGGAASSEPVGALFDPEALRSLFGAGGRLAGVVQSFADSAARDVAALGAAQDATRLAACAHRLRGAAQMAGARLIAEQAARAEAAAKAGDLAGARQRCGRHGALLAETLRVMRSVV